MEKIHLSLQLSGHTPSLREVGAGTLCRNLEAGADTEAMEGAAYWLVPHGLLSLLSYRTQDHSPGMTPPTMNWALPHQSLIKKMPYRLAYSLTL